MKVQKIILSISAIFLLAGCTSKNNEKEAVTTGAQQSTGQDSTNKKENKTVETTASINQVEQVTFSDEEFAAAAYMSLYSHHDKSIDDLFYWMTKEPEGNLSFEDTEDGLEFSQGTASSTFIFTLDEYKVYSKNVKPGSETTVNDKSDLIEEYKDYKKLVEKLVVVGKENVANSTASKQGDNNIDVFALTEVQAIDWVKNYLKQNGATDEEITNNLGFQTSMEDGYLTILEYRVVPTGNFKKLSYQYRINSEGFLEMRDVISGTNWTVISEEYIL